MRWLLFTIVTVLILQCCNSGNKNNNENLDTDLINNPATASDPDNSGKLPVIEFKNKTHDFKRVIQGEKVFYAFPFNNTGDANLIISQVVPSCGCTVPTFPKKPIKPGEKSYIKVVFDSKGRKGKFSKSVTVFANTVPNSVQLFIKGSIIKN